MRVRGPWIFIEVGACLMTVAVMLGVSLGVARPASAGTEPTAEPTLGPCDVEMRGLGGGTLGRRGWKKSARRQRR